MKKNILGLGVIIFIASISWWLIEQYSLNSKDEAILNGIVKNNNEILPTDPRQNNRSLKKNIHNGTTLTTSSHTPSVQAMAKQEDVLKPLDYFFSAWNSRNKEQLILAEDDLVEKLKHGNRNDIDKITATLLNADSELKYRMLQLLAHVASEDSFEILGYLAKNENFELRTAALEAIGNTQVLLSPKVTDSLRMQLDQAISQGDNSLVLALGRALTSGDSPETTVQLIAMVDDPMMDEPTSTALMQAVENAKSNKLVPYVTHYLEDDPLLTTNAAITTGNILANIHDSSSANAFIKWAEKADFDKVGEQARYWFNQLAQDLEIKSELRNVTQFHEFVDPRMGDLIKQIGIKQSR